MQAKISKTRVDNLEPGQILYDTEIKGFVARALKSGTITYGYRYRNGEGASKWLGLGIHGSITAEEARTLAEKRAGHVADERDPVAEQEEARENAAKAKRTEINTVDTILDAFVKRHASKLRSADQIEGALDRHVRPAIGAKSIYDLKRSEIVTMLDRVEDKERFGGVQGAGPHSQGLQLAGCSGRRIQISDRSRHGAKRSWHAGTPSDTCR